MYGRTYEELFGDDPDKVEDEEAPASEEGEPEVRFGYDPEGRDGAWSECWYVTGMDEAEFLKLEY
jgi:hypothetical protein